MSDYRPPVWLQADEEAALAKLIRCTRELERMIRAKRRRDALPFQVGDQVIVSDPVFGAHLGDVVESDDNGIYVEGPRLDSRVMAWTIKPEAYHLVSNADLTMCLVKRSL